MMELRIVIHGKLASNNAFKAPAGDRFRKTKEAREDAARVREIAIVAVTAQAWEIPESAEVRIVAYNSRLDWDNVPKIPGDSLKGIAWRDDADVMLGSVERRWDREGERYEIIVRPCEDRRPGRSGSKTGGAKRSPFSEYEQGQVLTIDQRDALLRKVGIR